jgi:hypothetical protein
LVIVYIYQLIIKNYKNIFRREIMENTREEIVEEVLDTDGSVIEMEKDKEEDDVFSHIKTPTLDEIMKDDGTIKFDTDALYKYIKLANIDADEAEILDMVSVIQLSVDSSKSSNEDIDYYAKLPKSLKTKIDMACASNGVNLNSAMGRKFLKDSAKSLLDEIYIDFVRSNGNIDIDSMMMQLKEYDTQMKNELRNLTIEEHAISIYMYIDTLKEKMESEEDAEKKNTIGKIVNALQDSIDLTKFIEFCKRVRIKHFELEKPNKVFNAFNMKYENHRLSINNITNLAPYYISKSFPGLDTKVYNSISIAFCKYCLNYKPDNIAEHTFMYYFIRNMINFSLIDTAVKADSLNKESEKYDRIVQFHKEYKEKVEQLIEIFSNKK